MSEQTQIPAEVLAAISDSLAIPEQDGEDLAALAAPFDALINADPAARAARDRIARAMSEHPTPPGPRLGPPYGAPLLAGQGHVRSAPYDSAGSDPAGRMFGFPQTGVLSVGGRVGAIQGAEGDRRRFTGWINIAVTGASVGASPGQTVRVSPYINGWQAGWTLWYIGAPSALIAGRNPWAEIRAGLAVKVFSANGFVTQNDPPVQLLQDHFDGVSAHWTSKKGHASDTSAPSMQVYFTIPAGETRWINFDAYVELTTGYNGGANQAAAEGGLNATVGFVVLEAL